MRVLKKKAQLILGTAVIIIMFVLVFPLYMSLMATFLSIIMAAPAIFIPAIIIGIAAGIYAYRRIWGFKDDTPKDLRELCPHFNVDHKGQCNLLVEPSECLEYCRTLKVIKR